MSRTHTAPGLKWALNERAALVGRKLKLEGLTPLAEQHAEKCRQRLERARVRLEALQAELAELTEKVAAFDRAIARLDPRVRADALGAINGSPKRYGEYGALS